MDTSVNFKLDNYLFSWAINNDTVIEPYEEPVVPALPWPFELTQFDGLHRYADTENLQSKLIIQIHISYLISYKNTVSMLKKIIISLLFLFVNTDVKAVVLHAFPQKQQSNNTTRDFVIVNEQLTTIIMNFNVTSENLYMIYCNLFSFFLKKKADAPHSLE